MLHYRRSSPPFCLYCRRELLPSTAKSRLALTMDHLHPKSDGGTYKVPCCRHCNELKGNLSVNAWRLFTDAYREWWRDFGTHAQVRAAIRALPFATPDAPPSPASAPSPAAEGVGAGNEGVRP